MYVAGHEPRILHEQILEELGKARKKFPEQDLWITLCALSEEVGELNQACLQYMHEPHKNVKYGDIRKEAIQVAAMAMRVILDTQLSELNPYK